MSDNRATSSTSPHRVPEALMAFLDRLGAELERRGDAVALLGLGSVGRDLHRLDEHSDADFFVVVDDEVTRDRYIADIDWLEAAQPVVWSFENSPVGRKALLEDDLFAEYAVFSVTDLAAAGYPPGRLHWQRADAPAGLETPTVPLPGSPNLDEQVGEAITNLYVGLHRDLRGERLTATRFIQGFRRRPLDHHPRPARPRTSGRSRTSSSSTAGSSGASVSTCCRSQTWCPATTATRTLLRPCFACSRPMSRWTPRWSPACTTSWCARPRSLTAGAATARRRAGSCRSPGTSRARAHR